MKLSPAQRALLQAVADGKVTWFRYAGGMGGSGAALRTDKGWRMVNPTARALGNAGLIEWGPHTPTDHSWRYVLTDKGREVLAALNGAPSPAVDTRKDAR